MAGPEYGSNCETVSGFSEFRDRVDLPAHVGVRVAAGDLVDWFVDPSGREQREVLRQDEARLEQRITGRLGDGTGAIDVSAVNGDIAVRLRDAAAPES